ncbi:MAG: non-ribosomal peptide synthetase, partial [bacterium]|nr:non-ribosomal peptide synthetase [bacterium]
DSLKAITAISAIHKHVNVQIPLPVFFEKPTVEKLSEYVENARKAQYHSITPAEKREYYPLSSAQKRLFFLQQMDTSSTNYNMPQVYPIHKAMSKERLEAILKKLITRHESLRTSFSLIGETPAQEILSADSLGSEKGDPARGGMEFSVGHYGAIEDIKRETKDFRRPFDITRPPLLRAALGEMKSGEKILLLDMHHIISDGVSQAVLIEEFKTLAADGQLPPISLQYKDYALWQSSPARHTQVKTQEEFWVNRLSGELPVLDLPLDYPRPAVQSSAGKRNRFRLNEEETKNLREIAAENNVTLYMLLLASYTVLLAKLSGQDDIIVGTPTAGRRHADFEKIIGMFVNTLPMRNHPRPEKTVPDYLLEVKKNTLEA